MISSDAKIRSLKIEDGKRHADRDGLVLEIRIRKSISSIDSVEQLIAALI